MTVVAHVVREAAVLTEPFITARVTSPIPGYSSEQWSEVGKGPEGIESIPIPSRWIRPGSTGSKVFHRVPQIGVPQAAVYRATVRTRRPGIIHAHYLTTGYLLDRVGPPLVVSAYGFDVSVMPQRALWRRAFRQLGRSRAIVLVEGPRMRDRAIELGFTPHHVRVVPIAVGHEHVAFHEKSVLSGRGPAMLAAGRFVEKKGHALAIRALGALRGRWPEATLDIIGSGALEADLRLVAANAGVTSAIRFLGSMPRDEYLERVAAADLFLAPSVAAANGDSEGGAPTTILDAQASGTVVVASTHADIPFLVSDGVTGFMAPEGDVEGLAMAIERALRESGRWPEIARAARAGVLAKHDGGTLAAALRSIYDEMTDR